MTSESEVKTASEEATNEEVVKAVAERLKFFFSDANVRMDNFMRQQLLKSEGEAGYVPIEVLLRFNSIKNHTTDAAVVVQAAKTLTDLLVLDQDEKSIARVKPFLMSTMDENIPLTLVVSNLPTDDGKGRYAVSMDEVRALFAPYGDVALVKLRFQRHSGDDDKGNGLKSPGKANKPAGEAFVEFETKEQQQKAAEELCTTKDGEKVEPKTKLTLGGNDLEVTTLRQWLDSRKKYKKVKDAESDVKGESKKREREEEVAVEIEEFSIDWKPGCVIQIKGLTEACDREAIRAAVAKGLGVTEKDTVEQGIYADYSRGQPGGAIRFNEPSEAIGQLAIKLHNGEVEIAGAKVESATILEGDEETKYWKDFVEFKNKQIRHKAEEKVSKRKRHHGGRR